MTGGRMTRVKGVRAASASVQDSDAALVAALVRRDPQAMEEVYDRYGRPAYSLARRITGDGQLAEDVVQEVFLMIWSDVGRFDPARGRLSTWLLTITHHKAVDAVRRERAVRRRSEQSEMAAGEAGSPSEVGDAVEASLRGQRVRTALAALPAAQREALTLAYFGGYTQREIADRIGTPLGTVKTRMLVGMRRLRDDLADAGEPTAEATAARQPSTDHRDVRR